MAKMCAICGKKIGMMTGKVEFLDGFICTKCYTSAGYGIGWKDMDEVESMGTISIAKWKRMKDPKASAAPEEFRIKCNTCGHLFCYTEDDIAMNKFYLRSAESDMKSARRNQLFVSSILAQGDRAAADRDLAQIKNFNRCPKCNSINLCKLSEAEFEKEKAVSSNATNTSVSSADELKKFKELLDSGVISQEEFDAKKKQLLGL